ncbi:peptidyl-prolyl cis-trans isomerase [Puccinia sorghi]|uniref:Peptidyl-prolyl cis-trans isomerase n=1 Tax=Puccinia sorghi TaxID=27349 RepID=A0A0L6UX88_9BASI|nr:peptidyl-prolyl cis-trans isomerase [Puccinia sorghi]
MPGFFFFFLKFDSFCYRVTYVGTFTDNGKQFDASEDPSYPFIFELGVGQSRNTHTFLSHLGLGSGLDWVCLDPLFISSFPCQLINFSARQGAWLFPPSWLMDIVVVCNLSSSTLFFFFFFFFFF